MNLEEINNRLKLKTPFEIVQWANNFNSDCVVTTNFRPYESAILHLVTSSIPNIKVIWCDTGYNTINTYKHAQELIQNLDLNIKLYVPKQTKAFRDAVMGIPNVEHPDHELFSEQVKIEPFTRAMQEHNPKVWFTNLRKGQTEFRDSLDIVSMNKEGVLKVSPFYNWTDKELDEYLNEHNLPNEFKYFDPTKVLENRECGIHN